MLSKIKSTNQEARVSLADTGSHSNTSEDEDAESINQDNNNNTNSNNNNKNGNGKNLQTERKRSQEELLDIVEISRERRLSKDSADSLGNFIRWSFGHRLDQHQTALQISTRENKPPGEEEQGRGEEEEEEGQEEPVEDMLASDEDDEDDWSAVASQRQQSFSRLNKFQDQQLHRQQQSKYSPTSGATNLTLAKNEKLSSSALSSDAMSGRGLKRARTAYMMDSPLPTISGSTPARKTSSYLGNVVERLHQQQLQQQQQQQQSLQEIDQEADPNASLSQHLQRFLQQQTSLEDLCSQVGIDDNNQLVLAAAIHRALVDSAAPNASAIDNKSTASSTGSSSGVSSNNNNSNNNNKAHNLSGRIQQASLNANSGTNLSLADPMNRQRRVYNTRAAMHGAMNSHHQQTTAATTAVGPASLAASLAQQTNSQPSSLGGRVHAQHQQQRHAQAAAALSALASVGSHLAAAAAVAGSHHPHQHAHPHHPHHHHPHQHPFVAGPQNPATLGVDFECDTCGSSFDDRHRLMQHQSIHLELKKDWFTETPVDEVMKIFNRRRGEFLCNICNLRFEATLDYDQHNHQVHGPRPYCCQFCGNGTRTFKCWRQYLNHLYDHRYIFSCTIDDCDFTVNRRDSLRFHIFRFHLNCQLPQNQQTQPLRVNQHHPPPNGLQNTSLVNGGGSRKWAPLPGMDDGDDLVRENEDLVNDEINVAD